MKRWMAALGACAALATLSGGAFARGYDPDGSALHGAVAGGLPGSSAAPPVAVVHEVRPPAWFRHRRHREW